jgi:hypothetical protein
VQAHTTSAEVVRLVYCVLKVQMIPSIVLPVKIVMEPLGQQVIARVVHTHLVDLVLPAQLVSTVPLALHMVSSVHQVPTQLQLAANQFLTVFKQQLILLCPLMVKQLNPPTIQCNLVMFILWVLLSAIKFRALLARFVTLILYQEHGPIAL